MKIVFITQDINYGGMSKMILYVASSLQKNGHDVTVLTFRKKLEMADFPFKYSHIQLETKSSFFSIITSSIQLRKYLKKNRFDIAIGFSTASQVRLALGCKFLKTKLLFSNRGDPYYMAELAKHDKKIKLSNFAFLFADYYVFQTQAAQNFYSKRIIKRSSIIPNPIEPLLRTQERNQSSIQNKIVALEQEKEVLESDILKLKDPDYIAKYVREKYYYSKDGEVILRIDGEKKND